MHVLIAPNAFKNSITADAAARAIERGLRKADPSITVTRLPVGDGGDGTGKLLIQELGAVEFDAPVKDPLGREIIASYGWIANNSTAIVEMADASGLRLLHPTEYDPMNATSYGTGQLIQAAIARGAARILLCIGGSATVDGGLGILMAAGFRFVDIEGYPIYVPADLHKLHSIEREGTGNFPELTVLCDVLNPLLRSNGSVAVFGPQKGADPSMQLLLEAGLNKLREAVLLYSGKDIGSIMHGGAAGGVAAGVYGLMNAQLVNGIDEFLKLVGFHKMLSKADWVITGEGSLDHQTLQGKAPVGVAKMAREHRVPVLGMAGQLPAGEDPALMEYFQQMICINKVAQPLEKALHSTAMNLEQSAFEWAAENWLR